MRKPRDIDAQLKALNDRAKALKSRKITQLGELVIATGAADLPADVLAGVLLSAIETTDSTAREGWTRKGAAFFLRQPASTHTPQASSGDDGSAGEDPGDGEASSSRPGQS